MRRYHIVFLVLVLVVLAVLIDFAAAPAEDPQPPTWGAVLAGWAPVLLLFSGLIALLWLTRTGLRHFNAAVALVQQNKLSAAIERLEVARNHIGFQPVVPLQLGVCRLLLWQLAQAEAELETAHRSRMPTNPRAVTTGWLALCRAIRGNTEGAERALAEARQRHGGDAATTLLAGAVLSCRTGDWAGARALLTRNELRALSATPRAIAEALEAWCAEQLDGTGRDVDVAGVIGDAQIEDVRSAWPAFAAFLERDRGRSAARA